MRPTLNELREYLEYDALRGSFRWLKVNSNRAKAGNIAGHARSGWYVKIGFNGAEYLVHHLVWLFETGEWPVGQVDHRNLDRQDNRIENLRLATSSQQKMNMGLRSDNTSGVKGVWFNKNLNKWAAEIKSYGKKRYLGAYEHKADAIAVRRSAELIYHGEFARSA